MQETVLELKNYSVSFDTPDGEVQAVRNVDLTVKKGEILCIVGESGCGKTVMCRSVMKLLPPNAHVKSGEISLCGENITAYKRKKMEKLCGSKVSMVFQDPMLTLNPTIPVGKQITEAIIKNQKVSRDEAKKRAVEMLKLVGIPDAEQRYGLQPHFFSGGMRQRCVLAIALACDPEILFADEATTALDATVEAKILDLLLELREKTGISIVSYLMIWELLQGSQTELQLCMQERSLRSGQQKRFIMIPGILIPGDFCLLCLYLQVKKGS